MFPTQVNIFQLSECRIHDFESSWITIILSQLCESWYHCQTVISLSFVIEGEMNKNFEVKKYAIPNNS